MKMKKMKHGIMLVTMLAGALAVNVASAQVYAGATIGKFHWTENCQGGVRCSNANSGYKVFAGYTTGSVFSIEASYADLGKMAASASANSAVGSSGEKIRSMDLAGVLRARFGSELMAFAKLGVASVKTPVSSANTNGLVSSESSLVPVGGVGVTVNFTKELSARAELETRKVKFAGGKESVTNVSIGMQYSF